MTNKQSISKIISCLDEFYLKQSTDTDFFYDTTLYLVNNGVSFSDVTSYTNIYFGSHKVSSVRLIDSTVTTEDLKSDEYPSNKIYLQPLTKVVSKYDEVVIGFNTYIKVDNSTIVDISNNRINKPSVLVETPEEVEDKTFLKMTVNYDNQVEQVLVNIFCVDDEGWNERVYNTLLSYMKSKLARIPGHEVMRWRNV